MVTFLCTRAWWFHGIVYGQNTVCTRAHKWSFLGATVAVGMAKLSHQGVVPSWNAHVFYSMTMTILACAYMFLYVQLQRRVDELPIAITEMTFTDEHKPIVLWTNAKTVDLWKTKPTSVNVMDTICTEDRRSFEDHLKSSLVHASKWSWKGRLLINGRVKHTSWDFEPRRDTQARKWMVVVKETAIRRHSEGGR